MPGHANGDLLDHFIGFRVGQAGADGEITRQLAVNPVKLLPALHVIAFLEAVEQAQTSVKRGDWSWKKGKLDSVKRV